MATVTLLPNADISNDWTLSTATDVYDLLDDTTATLAGDTSYLYSTTSASECEVALEDFSEAYSVINSIRLTTASGNAGRGQSHELRTFLNSASGNYYTELSGSIPAHRFNYITTNYTTRTTHNGSDAWTQALLNDLRVKVVLYAHSGGTTQFTYLKIEVDYDLPVSADNSILFGTNF